MLGLFLVAGTVHAQTSDEPQAGLVPGDALYIFDVIAERLGDLLAFTETARAERALNQASERLAEARELTNRGKDDLVADATKKYEERLAKAMERAEKARAEGRDVLDVLRRIIDATSKHEEVLTEVLSRVPDEAKDAIENALERSREGHEHALEVEREEEHEDADEEELEHQEEQERETHREEAKQQAESDQRALEQALENSDLSEEEREALKQEGERIREEAKQEAERQEESSNSQRGSDDD